MSIQPNLYRRVPLVIEMHNVPTRQQEQILWYLLHYLSRFSGAMDATGPGQTLAEYTADEFGTTRIAQINLNRAWYAMWMPKLIQAFEDGVIPFLRMTTSNRIYTALKILMVSRWFPLCERRFKRS